MDDVFRIAARYGDAETEEHGLEAAIRKEGIPFEELLHAADQRALRVTLMASGRPMPDTGNVPIPVALTGEERLLQLTVLMPAYMDGLYIGWRARRLAAETLTSEVANRAEAAIQYLTGNELSPSTVDLLALEGLKVADWIEEEEGDELITRIMDRYRTDTDER